MSHVNQHGGIIEEGGEDQGNWTTHCKINAVPIHLIDQAESDHLQYLVEKMNWPHHCMIADDGAF